MNLHNPLGAPSPLDGPRSRRETAPNAAPSIAVEPSAAPIPGVESSTSSTGGAGAANPFTFPRCPDCDGPFSYRIIDEDSGCAYPVDDGEHYCDFCDALWTDEYLAECSFEPTGWLLAEQAALQSSKGEG